MEVKKPASASTIKEAVAGIVVVTSFVAVVTVFDLNRFMLSPETEKAGPAIYVAMWGMVVLAWVLLGSTIIDDLRNRKSDRPAPLVKPRKPSLPYQPLGRRFWYPFGVLVAFSPLIGYSLFEIYPGLYDAYPLIIVGVLFLTLASGIVATKFRR